MNQHPLGYPSRPTQARYKGRTSLKSLEQDFPHIVEMIVPEGGFGKQLDAMYERHIHQGIRAINSTGRRDDTRSEGGWPPTEAAYHLFRSTRSAISRHS